MAYQSWSVVFGEQPTAAKWNILGTNDASFHDGTGIDTNAIDNANLQAASVTGDKIDTGSIIFASATPGGNSDTTTSWADWGASTTITVPSWANRALVITSVQGWFIVTSASTINARTVIGSDTGTTSGQFGDGTAASANRMNLTWHDYITLTGTGSKTIKVQGQRASGTGEARVDAASQFNWTVIFLRV